MRTMCNHPVPYPMLPITVISLHNFFLISQRKAASDRYWKEFESLQKVFRACVDKAKLPEDIQKPFFQSVTVCSLLHDLAVDLSS